MSTIEIDVEDLLSGNPVALEAGWTIRAHTINEGPVRLANDNYWFLVEHSETGETHNYISDLEDVVYVMPYLVNNFLTHDDEKPRCPDCTLTLFWDRGWWQCRLNINHAGSR